MSLSKENRILGAKVIGENIRRYRNSKLVTIQDLVERTDSDEKHLGRVERVLSVPGGITLIKLSIPLDASVNQLVDGAEEFFDIEPFE